MHGDDIRSGRAEEGDRSGRDDGEGAVAVRSTCRAFGFAVLLAGTAASLASAEQSAQRSAPATPANASAPASAIASKPAPATAPSPASANAPAVASPALEPQGYTYDPQGRRDPFVSLLRRGSDVPRSSGGSRANGLAGLETSEVTLKGTIASQGTYVGILQGSDSKTYIVRAGDKLLDGTIRAINPDSLVIAQQVSDPLSLEKQREVRKVLRQTEEAK
jgi:type IV pilus assembly protein PilP